MSESNIFLHSTKSTRPSGLAGLPSQGVSGLSRVAPDDIKPTAAYGTGRTKSYFPPLNSTQGKPQITGFPSSGRGRDLPYPCSGTYTIGPGANYTVTLTTTAIIGTTTIAYGAPLPNAVFVKPLPFCTTLTASNCSSDACDTGSFPFALSYATVLITKKTSAVSYEPSSVGPIFEASTTPVPVQHTPESDLHRTIPSTITSTSSQAGSAGQSLNPGLHTPVVNVGQLPGLVPESDLQKTISSATHSTSSIAESGGQSSNPELDTPVVNIGQLPGLVPNLLHSPESGSASSGSSSAQGSSTPQNGNSASSNSAHPGQVSQNPGVQGSEGSSQSGQSPNSESSDDSTGNESPGNESGASEGNMGSSENASPGSSGTASHKGEYPPAVVINPGITTLNHVPVSIGPGGVVVGSHTVAPGPQSTILTVNGQTFTIEPSRIVAGTTTLPFSIAPDQPYTTAAIGSVPVTLGPKIAVIASATYTLGSSPTAIVYDAQTYFLESSKLVAAQTTVNLPYRKPPFAFVTAGGEIFSVYSSQLEAPGITIAIPTGPYRSQFVHRGETFTINPSQLIVPDKTVPLPWNMITPAPSAVSAEGIMMSIGPSAVVIGSRTYSLQNPSSIVYNGHTISLGSNGVGLASTTIAFPSVPSFSTVTEGALTLIVNPSEAVIQGHSYPLSQGATPITTVIQGQTISIGPDGIAFTGTTAVIPRPSKAPYLTTIDGMTFSVGPTDVVVAGKTYAIGGGAGSQTVTIGSEILSFGPEGVGLPGTTIAPAASMVTADGLTFSLDPTDVAISGTTYQIGAGARATTITVGGETISIGPGGIGLPDTTIPPPSTTTPGSSSSNILSPATPSSPEASGLAYEDFAGAGTTSRIPIDNISLLSFLTLWTLILLLA